METSKADGLCHKTLDFLKRHNLGATPANYETMYTYFSYDNIELRKTLDIIVSNCRNVTQDTLSELHSRFLGNAQPNETLIELGKKLESELSAVMDYIGETSRDTGHYGQTLSVASAQLTASPADRSPAQLIETLLRATRQMEQRTKALEQRLNASTDQVNQLKGDLEAVRNETLTDAMTGIANRRAFDKALRHAAVHAMETDDPLCLALCDIDRFKSINDTWGHQTGDHVLRLIALCLRQNVEDPCLAARYGGEEFALILPQDLTSSIDLAETIRKIVASRKMVRRSTGEEIGQITISFGIAQFTPGEPLATLIERADACLYAAKRNGRNQVISQDTPADTDMGQTNEA